MLLNILHLFNSPSSRYLIHQLSSCDICNIYFLCVKEKGAWFCGLGCYLGGNDMKRWFSIFTRCSKRNTYIKL